MFLYFNCLSYFILFNDHVYYTLYNIEQYELFSIVAGVMKIQKYYDSKLYNICDEQ